MGPSTTSKNTSTIFQSSSRRGSRQVHKQRVEKYEGEVVNDNGEVDDLEVDDGYGDDDAESSIAAVSQDRSQGLTIEVQKELDQMHTTRKARNEARKQEVHKAYDKAQAETQEAITSYFDEHEARASEAHDAQMARLKHLLKKKVQIETIMAEKVNELRKDYVYHSRALEMVVEHRMKQLNWDGQDTQWLG